MQPVFDQLAVEWNRHCESVMASSRLSDRLNCEAYRKIVALGNPAVPQIMGLIDADAVTPWELALAEITGVRFIEDLDNFDLSQAVAERKRWWAASRPPASPGSAPPSPRSGGAAGVARSQGKAAAVGS